MELTSIAAIEEDKLHNMHHHEARKQPYVWPGPGARWGMRFFSHFNWTYGRGGVVIACPFVITLHASKFPNGVRWEGCNTASAGEERESKAAALWADDGQLGFLPPRSPAGGRPIDDRSLADRWRSPGSAAVMERIIP